jgi:preprotein translocase subunit SecG
MLEVLRVILFIAFILASLFLIIIILLQEGKGGGLAGAFGGVGGETFGVGSGGINKATSILAAIFIGAAVILGATQSTSIAPESEKPVNQQPADGGGTDGPPIDNPATGTGG